MIKFNELFKIDSKIYKLYKVLYIILFVITVWVGIYTSNESKDAITISKIPLYGILIIFINNFFLIIIWLLYSPLGMSIFFIIKFLVHFGQVGIESGINPIIYYGASLTHGLGELFVSFIIFIFTIEQFITWINFAKYKNFKNLEEFYKNFLRTTFPVIIFILLVSACFEVLISNRLINIILK